MKRSRFLGLTGLVAALAAAAATVVAVPATAGTSAPTVTQSAGVMHVGFAVQKFVKRGTKLVAIGRTVTTVTDAQGVTHTSITPFTSVVTKKSVARSTSVRSTQAATRICDVLNLNLAPLHLALLGLIVDLDRVVLTIKADSNGGLLGSLLCGLAGGGGILGTATNAATLTNVAQSSGLSVGPGFNVPLNAAAGGGSGATPQAVAATCTVLDLSLGPLHLSLLGLIVDLNRVHLVISADPAGGLLGSLLCGLAGGVPPVPVVPTPTGG